MIALKTVALCTITKGEFDATAITVLVLGLEPFQVFLNLGCNGISECCNFVL